MRITLWASEVYSSVAETEAQVSGGNRAPFAPDVFEMA